jgi:hypothetical protein
MIRRVHEIGQRAGSLLDRPDDVDDTGRPAALFRLRP